MPVIPHQVSKLREGNNGDVQNTLILEGMLL